ncbi:MAG: tetratricopeptide repeat protein [Bacteroidia bacterium]|nr:tetratricopeptide repeat protein [Bacteroidia bacterium]
MRRVCYRIAIGIVIIIGVALYSCSKKVVPSAVTGSKIKPYDTAAFNYVYVEAIKQKLLGNGGDALKLLEQIIKIKPESDAAYFQMAQILIGAGDIANGKKYALKAYSIDQGNFWYLMMLAGTYYGEGNIDSAILFYEKAVKKFPEKESLQVTLANLYSENKKFDRAIKIFEDLDQKYGINESSSAGSVKNLMWEEKWDQALEKANLLLKEFPDNIIYNGLLAEIYRGKGEPERAEEVYKSLIERNPGNGEIQLALCDFLIEEKRYEDLLLLLNVVTINENVRKEDKIALFARIIGTPEIVKKIGEKAVLSLMVFEAAYPKDDLILLFRPELLISMERIKDAETRLEDIIDKRPENYYAWEKLLLVYLQLGDYVNLEKKGEECASKFNRSFLAKLLYATAATENKKYDIAIEELRKANILAGDNKDMLLQVLSLQADVYYKKGEYNKAFETFDEALKKNNENLTLLNNYAYYLAEKNMNLKEAEEMAKKVIEKEKTNNTYLDTYAWVLYKRGKYKEASKIMEEIMRNGKSDDAEFYEHYGYILKKQHNCTDAVKYWEKALILDNKKVNLKTEIDNCKR